MYNINPSRRGYDFSNNEYLPPRRKMVGVRRKIIRGEGLLGRFPASLRPMAGTEPGHYIYCIDQDRDRPLHLMYKPGRRLAITFAV